jgi:hypothetical protein
MARIGLDKTPPTGARASSPNVSAEETFVVSWGGTATDGSGSGLSGKYNVRVLRDNGNWQSWLTDFTGDIAEYQGAHGHTYKFEVVAHDNLGNVEAFNQIAEATTLVDTTAKDTNAPGPPRSLTASGLNPSPWQKDPAFQIAWQAPNDPSGIGKALYKLGNPPTANFDTTGSVAGGSSIRITATQEDGQNFYLWFSDLRGNVDYRNRGVLRLRYDGTLPEIKSLTSANADFSPYWYDQGRTTTAQVRVNYRERHPQKLRVVSTRLNLNNEVDRLSGGDDVSYLFNINIQGKLDGLYELEFTLIDSAGNSISNKTNIALDNTPPTGARASSPDTTAEETFVVSWGGTATDGSGSGLSGNYDARVQIDGGGWNLWLTNFSGTSAEYYGAHAHKYAFEVAARDNVGNVEPLTRAAETTTYVDTTLSDAVPPSITHTPTTVVEVGSDIDIQAQIQDTRRVAAATLFYKRSGEKDFQSMAMTKVSGATYRATLPAALISTKGANYYIKAYDGVNSSYHPSQNWNTRPHNLAVRIVGTNNQGLVKAKPQPGGSNKSAFRMISMPLVLENPRAQAVLEDDLGRYNRTSWRCFQYNPLTGSYAEFPDIEPFSPGKAFWLIVRDDNKVLDSGIGATAETNQPFQITLQRGWNDLANPFSFPVNWSEVKVVQGNAAEIMGPYTYNGEWLLPNQVTTLLPWEGYSVYSLNANTVISISPVEAVVPQGQTLFKSETTADWQLGLVAVCDEAVDGANLIGVAREASAEWDNRDYLEPPPIGEYVSLRFPHEDWQKFRGAFSTDFRPPFADGQTWYFEIATNIASTPITLKFQNIESLHLEFQALLLDLTTRTQIDIRQSGQYVFVPDQRRLTREFELIVGTALYIENLDELKPINPQEFSISQNFPNPFNAGTSLVYQVPAPSRVSIAVLNVLGQKVRQLISQQQQPGSYRVHWDGKADDGRELESGIYIIKFEAGHFRQTRKVLLIQ